MEKYSVLLSLYRKENPEFLRLALESMLAQTVPADEIVLVKDGPLTEELDRTVAEYTEKYPDLFHIVPLAENRGLGIALNEGLKVCRNELVARMDTDDISFPDRCEKQLAVFASDPSLSIVGADVAEFIEDPDVTLSIRQVPRTHEEIYRFAKRRSAFNHPVVMYKKSDVLSVGGYADLRRNQDVDLFGRMLFQGFRAANIAEPLLHFRSGDALAKRRRSWENTKLYIRTIKHFWKMGYSSFGDYLVVACAQTAMFLLPVKLQHWVYKKFLRK